MVFKVNRAMAKRLVATVATGLIFPPLLLKFIVTTQPFLVRRTAFGMAGVVYGLTLKLGPTADGTRHLEKASYFYEGMSFSTFLGQLLSILRLEGTPGGVYDPFVHFVSYVSTGLLGAPSLFFPIIGWVFGWYFGGAVLLALRRFRWENVNYVLGFFIVVLLFLRGLNEIQAVRMWTAMWLAVYSTLAWSDSKKVSALIPFFLAPLVHFSFLIICPAIALAWLFRRRRWAVSLAFLATSIVSVPLQMTGFGAIEDTALFESRSSYITDRASTSSSERTQQSAGSSGSWYLRFVRSGGIDLAFSLLAVVLIASGFYRMADGSPRDLLSVGIGLMVFSNLVVFAPALASRTNFIAATFLLLGFISARLVAAERKKSFTDNPGLYKYGINIATVALLPILLYSLSSNTEGISYLIFFTPGVALLFPDMNMSIKEFILFLL